ncbi:MAG: AAA family ATPase [bacterium]|nr:AAA family ATPase [bacterium]
MTQNEALEILKTGRNCYITGPAGSGKTHLLNKYIEYLKKNEVSVGVTASTGIAATHLGGVTIHSWTGMGIRDFLSKEILEDLEGKQYLWKRMEKASVLVIDEISMLHHFRLDMVDMILRAFKRNDVPFGGIQVVLCGDFFQLPPIRGRGEEEPFFAYRAKSWQEGNFTTLYLGEQYRQDDDIFLKVLNAIRAGRGKTEARKHLEERLKAPRKEGVIQTMLYTHNVDVDRENEKELSKIGDRCFEYKMSASGNPYLVATLKKSCLAPEILKLKVGARVMFVKNNFDAGYVNGTLGTVTSASAYGATVETALGHRISVEKASWMVEEDGRIKAEVEQLPLRLAWAITVHKSQGMTMDAVKTDLSKSFEKGMGYVALSRVRSFLGLTLLGLNEVALEINEEVLAVDGEFFKSSARAAYEFGEIGEKEKILAQREFLGKVGGRANKKTIKVSTFDETKKLLLEKMSLGEMAERRGFTKETIISHIEKISSEDFSVDVSCIRNELPKEKLLKITSAFERSFEKTGGYNLAPVKAMLGGKFSYLDIRLARLFLKKAQTF